MFKCVFLFHWKEESQYETMDELEWAPEDATLATNCGRDAAIADRIALVGGVDGIQPQQAQADTSYLLQAAGMPTDGKRAALVGASALQACRWQHIVSATMEPRCQKMWASLVDEAQVLRIQTTLGPLAYAVPDRPELMVARRIEARRLLPGASAARVTPGSNRKTPACPAAGWPHLRWCAGSGPRALPVVAVVARRCCTDVSGRLAAGGRQKVSRARAAEVCAAMAYDGLQATHRSAYTAAMDRQRQFTPSNADVRQTRKAGRHKKSLIDRIGDFSLASGRPHRSTLSFTVTGTPCTDACGPPPAATRPAAARQTPQLIPPTSPAGRAWDPHGRHTHR